MFETTITKEAVLMTEIKARWPRLEIDVWFMSFGSPFGHWMVRVRSATEEQTETVQIREIRDLRNEWSVALVFLEAIQRAVIRLQRWCGRLRRIATKGKTARPTRVHGMVSWARASKPIVHPCRSNRLSDEKA